MGISILVVHGRLFVKSMTTAIPATLGLAIAALSAGLLIQPANAQVLYGSIVGTVIDASGASVASASVVATDTATAQTRQTSTDEAGRFLISNAWPGSYELKVSASGFRPFVKTDVGVTVNTVTRVDVQLELGALTEQVTVAGTATTIQTDKADVHVELSTSDVVNLPLANYRNFQSLINLVPGATPAAFQNALLDTPERALTTNVNGANRYSNNTRVDGALSINIFLPHDMLIVPPVESVETVNVVTNNFDPEQGMAGGAAVTVVTKSGTNEFHGSAFAFHNDQHLLARDFFAVSKPKSIMNIGGGTFGGPIRENKLFFFSSWEGTFQRLGWSGLFTVPTADQRAGNFATYGTTIYDPATGNPDGTGRTPFPGMVIPSNRQSSIMQTVVGLIPLPNQMGTVSNYFNSGTQSLNRNNLDFKVNWIPTSAFTVWGKYSMMDALVQCGPALGAAGASGTCDAGIGHTLSQMATIGHTWTVTPRLVVDGSFGFARHGLNVIAASYWGQNYGAKTWGFRARTAMTFAIVASRASLPRDTQRLALQVGCPNTEPISRGRTA